VRWFDVLRRPASWQYWLLLIVGAVVSLVPTNVDGLPGPLYLAFVVAGIVLIAYGGQGLGRQLEGADAEALRHDADLTRVRMEYPYRRMQSFYDRLGDMQFYLVQRWRFLGGGEEAPPTRVPWHEVDKTMNVLSEHLNAFIKQHKDAHEEWRGLLPEELAKMDRDAALDRATEIVKK
jgi:hypothetical protein